MKPTPRKARPSEVAAAAAFFLAMLVLAVTLVQLRLAQGAPKPTGDSPRGTMYAPSVEQEGVVVTPGRGRLLFVDSTPGNAEVVLDGAPRGETPFSSDFACDEETPSVLEVNKAGYRRARFELKCLPGSTRVTVTLKKR